jgi:hypothetical protein
MVKSLPATGSVVVVHTLGLRDYVARMIRDVRGPEVAKVTIVAVCRSRPTSEKHLLGRTLPVLIDHAFYDNVPTHLAKLVQELAHGCNAIFPPGAFTAVGLKGPPADAAH